MYQLSHPLSKKKSQPRSETSLTKFFSNPISNNSMTYKRRTSEASGDTLENFQFTTHTSNPFNKRRHSSSKNLFVEAKKSLSKEKSLSIQKKKSHSKFQVPSKKDALRNLDTNGVKTKHIQDILRLKMSNNDQVDHKKKKQYVEEDELRKIIEKSAAHSRKIEHTVEIVLERAITQNMYEERLNTLQSQFSAKRQKKLSSTETVSLSIKPTKLTFDQNKKFQKDLIDKPKETYAEPSAKQEKKEKESKINRSLEDEKQKQEKLRKAKEAQMEKQKIEEKQQLKKLEIEKKRLKEQKEAEKQKQRLEKQKKKQMEIEKQKKQQLKPPKVDYFRKGSQASDVDSIFSGIQDITLSPESKITLKKSPTKNKNKEKDEQNKKKENEEQLRKEKQMEKQKQKLIQERQRKQEQRQRKEKQKEEAKQKKRKQEIANQISEANRIIDLMTPVGEVAGYCSQVLKKSKLNWHTPATLLYKECYQKFKSFESIYEKAADERIIENEEKDRYLEDNEVIATNLEKITQMAKKKNKIKPEYEKMVTSPEPQDLSKFIQKEVLAFSQEMKGHPEGQVLETQMCLLRMINSVLIMAKLRGMDVEVMEDIDQIKGGMVGSKIKEKVKVVEKIKFGR